MKKVRLDLDALSVQSYPTTTRRGDARGTVYGWEVSRLADGCASGNATCLSACSATNGIVICKSCGPCCYE